MKRDAVQQPAQSNPRQAEIQQAIEDAQRAVQEAARTSAREAEAAADRAARQAEEAQQGRPAGAPEPPEAPPRPGTIVIPTDDGNRIEISVDGGGIHLSQNGTETTIPIRDVVPRGAVQMTYAICTALVAIAFISPLMRFFLRRHERKIVTNQLSAAVQERLDAMERNVDTVAVELERVSEGQRFTAKLLEQRPLEHAQRSDR